MGSLVERPLGRASAPRGLRLSLGWALPPQHDQNEAAPHSRVMLSSGAVAFQHAKWGLCDADHSVFGVIDLDDLLAFDAFR